MPRLKIGRVSFAFKGAWSPSVPYERLDVVTYSGSSWAAKADVVPEGVIPSESNTDYWNLVASKGEQGTQGPAGDAEALSWENIGSKPQTATRWPNLSEVGNVPETATRWPQWDEVSDKPSSFPVDASSHDHTQLIVKPFAAPFDNATNDPRSFYSAGLCVVFVEDTYGWPIPFGRLLNIPSFSAAQDGGAFQLLIPYSSSYGDAGQIMWRKGKFNNDGWTDWDTPATTENLSDVEQTLTGAISGKVDSSAFTAANILSLLMTVDGNESGLNAQFLGGQDKDYYYSPANPPPAGAVVDTASVLNATKGATYRAVGSYSIGTITSGLSMNQGVSGSSIGLSSGSWRVMGAAGSQSTSGPTGGSGTTYYRYLCVRYA